MVFSKSNSKFVLNNSTKKSSFSRCPYDKTGVVKYKTEFKGFPLRVNIDNLPEGLYFINILYNGKTYTMRVVIKH
ncbi:MAG: T9SS type A sorting domain-containing protein [Bacteroidales bacterium]|nr:T9SS type A sorting domain-containing protein [Bacteroidales bacterium]